MGDFGTDTERYQTAHDCARRKARDADLGTARAGGDMRLSVFHYPLNSWADAVVFNVLMGAATGVQMTELTRLSYAPMAEVFREIAPREARHAALGVEGLTQIAMTDKGRAQARTALSYWHHRVAASFGTKASPRFEALKRFGLRRQSNEALLADWTTKIDAQLAALNLA